MKKNEKKVIRYYSYFWLFVYRQGSSVDSRMDEWMKTRNDTEMETESENVQVSTTHVYKCTYNVEA